MIKTTLWGTTVTVMSRRDVEENCSLILAKQQPTVLVTANAEMFWAAAKNSALQGVINQADFSVIDSVGLAWALKRLQGIKGIEVYPGVELVQWLITYRAKRVFVLGGTQKTLNKLNLPNIVGTHHGYFNDQQEQSIIKQIVATKPDLLLVGMGVGKQERFLIKHRKQLAVPLMIGVGGAIDVISGVKKRAPELFIRLKLEWFYRVLVEPARFYRQINLLFFALKVLFTKKGHLDR